MYNKPFIRFCGFAFPVRIPYLPYVFGQVDRANSVDEEMSDHGLHC